MSTFSDLLPEASAVLALASVGGMGLQWGALKALRDRRDDQDKESAAQKAKITDLEQQRAEDKAEIAQLKSDLTALGRVVTGEVHWQAISDMLEHHHELAKGHWDIQEDLLKQVIEVMRKIKT